MKKHQGMVVEAAGDRQVWSIWIWLQRAENVFGFIVARGGNNAPIDGVCPARWATPAHPFSVALVPQS